MEVTGSNCVQEALLEFRVAVSHSTCVTCSVLVWGTAAHCARCLVLWWEGHGDKWRVPPGTTQLLSGGGTFRGGALVQWRPGEPNMKS